VISIIIPLYNKRNSILFTVNSVLAQSFCAYELIIVNDGSTDDSLFQISSIKDPRIRVLNKENGGVSSARNFGIINAKFDLIAFLDADDIWENDFLEQMLNFRENHSKASIFACNILLKSKSSEKNAIDFLQSGYVKDYFKVALDHAIVTSSSVILEKKVFNVVGVFNEGLTCGEDLDMWFRILNKFQLAFLNLPLASYCLSEFNYNFSRIDFSKDFISKISDIPIEDINWEQFKTYYMAKSLKPYYIFRHSDEIQRLVDNLKFKYLPFKFYLFYHVPRSIIGLLYAFYLNFVLKIKVKST
jgi:glycosyltransferase involved in cell wall biosynthesis